MEQPNSKIEKSTPSRRNGLMLSKYASISASLENVPFAKQTKSFRSESDFTKKTRPHEISNKPKIMTFVASKLASDEDFLTNVPKPRTASYEVIEDVPAPSEVKPLFLTLTHDAAPSVSFWVPNFPQISLRADADFCSTNDFTLNKKTTHRVDYADASTATTQVATPWRPTATFKDLPTSVLECIFNNVSRARKLEVIEQS